MHDLYPARLEMFESVVSSVDAWTLLRPPSIWLRSDVVFLGPNWIISSCIFKVNEGRVGIQLDSHSAVCCTGFEREEQYFLPLLAMVEPVGAQSNRILVMRNEL
jgi:hypothetical protein